MSKTRKEILVEYFDDWDGKGMNAKNGVSVTREADQFFIYAAGDLMFDFGIRPYGTSLSILDMAIRLLKLDKSDEQYESAVGQIRGFVSGSQGDFFERLLEGMALTLPEWERMKIQDADFVASLPAGIVEEIEEYVNSWPNQKAPPNRGASHEQK